MSSKKSPQCHKLLYLQVLIAIFAGLLPGYSFPSEPAVADCFKAESLKPLIPHNIVAASAEGNLLQILLISLLCGYAAARLNAKAKPFIDFLRSFSEILFGIIHVIMKLAPIGALGAMAFTVGKYGLGSITGLLQLLGSFYATCIFFILLVPGLRLYFCGINIFKFLRYLKEELLIVLGTSSSEAALPGLMEKMEKTGCSKSVTGLVIPTGCSFALGGTAIYLTMAAVFIAQATNTPLDLKAQLCLLVILLMTSKGAAGVTGSGFITLAAALPMTHGIPVADIRIRKRIK